MSDDEVTIHVACNLDYLLQPGWEVAIRVHRPPTRPQLVQSIEVVAVPPSGELDRLTHWLHSRLMHPDFEYKTTDGQRKTWDDADQAPDGEGWERNVDYGDEGWERFDYHEESYWRRRNPQSPKGGGA